MGTPKMCVWILLFMKISSGKVFTVYVHASMHAGCVPHEGITMSLGCLKITDGINTSNDENAKITSEPCIPAIPHKYILVTETQYQI